MRRATNPMFRSSLVRPMAVSSLGLTMATAWSQDFPTPPLISHIIAVNVTATTTLVGVSYLQPQMKDINVSVVTLWDILHRKKDFR